MVEPRRAAAVLATIAALWGSIGVFVRHADLPPAAIVGLRLWLGAAVLGVIHLARGGGPLLPQRRLLAIAAGAVQSVHWLALVAALQRAPIGTVLLITYLAPVVIAAASGPLLHERVSLPTWCALGAGLIGTGLLARSGGDAGTNSAGSGGLALAAVAGLTLSLLILCGRVLAPVLGGVRLGVIQLGVAGVLVIPFAATASWGDPRRDWVWAIVLALVHTGLATAAYLWCLARLPATQASVLLYVEPVSAVLFGWMFLDERPGASAIGGGLLVVGAGIMVVRSSRDGGVVDVPR